MYFKSEVYISGAGSAMPSSPRPLGDSMGLAEEQDGSFVKPVKSCASMPRKLNDQASSKQPDRLAMKANEVK